MRRFFRPSSCGRDAFTLVELLVATTILLLVMVLLLQMTGGVGQIWTSSSGKISAYQSARSAFTTLNGTLARATVNTYNDYVDASGNPRTTNNAANFSPQKFLRTSELQIVFGPADQILPGATAPQNPGDAVFFQAALGDTDTNSLASLNRTLNSVGFYVQYGAPDGDMMPSWLQPFFGTTKKFRLMQVIVPTESQQIYNSTTSTNYDLGWLQAFKTPRAADQPRPRVLAEDVPLLIFRPRLSPQDEETIAPELGVTYSAARRGSILSPNYHYDSRAWEGGYPAGQRVLAASGGTARSGLMRNQLPPIVDVVIVSVDNRSLSRFDQTQDAPPAPLVVPAGLFVDSSKLDDDLTTYGKQLSDARIRYKVFRTSVQIQGARWSSL
jgi:uncharacterized protein (TIGR02599 family)